MRHGLGLIVAVLAAWTALPARAQEPEAQHWPMREINFPVPLDKIQAMNPRPSKLRFYVARDRGRFERVAERAITDLEVIDPAKGSKGFRYTASADGEYSFSIQLVYPDGDTNPRDADLTAHRRVVVDTHPPQVRIAAVGTTGVEWEVTDDNARPDGIGLQVRYRGQPQWTTVKPQEFGLRDRYTWRNLTAREPIEVRVVARDRAGHEGVSVPPFVTLPTGGAGTGLEAVRPASDRGGSGFGNPDDFPTRPEIRYVNSHTLTVESKLTRVTRSGVPKAHLWVNDGKLGWKHVKEQPTQITATDRDPTIPIAHKVEKDGLYGFIVIPENGAGGKQDDPRPGDPAQFLIEVDTDRPFVKVKGHRVTPGGTAGPRVEIEWEATDKNLWEEPITLEYSTDKAGAQWTNITSGKLRNSGRYVWEVEDKNLWRVYVRATALDKAGNPSVHVYEKEILIDLEKPAAVIEKVQGSGGPSPTERDSHRPPAEQTPASAPSSPTPSSPTPSSPAPSSPTPVPTSPVVPSAPTPAPVPGGNPVTLPVLPDPLKEPGKG